MMKRLNYKRTEQEITHIRQHMAYSDPKVTRRATILDQLHRGDSPRKVAENSGVCLATVYNTVKRYNKQGLPGLYTRPKSGRPRILTEVQRRLLTRTIATPPHQLGYLFETWTLKQLQAHISHVLGAQVSLGTLRNELHRQGYFFITGRKLSKRFPVRSDDWLAAALDLYFKAERMDMTRLSLSHWTTRYAPSNSSEKSTFE